MSFKERLVFDSANPDDTDNVGSYLRSSDGTLITHTSESGKEALDVHLTNANISVTQGTSPWVVSATDLDIRDLDANQDNVAISDGTDTLEINADGSINVNATITDPANYAEDSAHTTADIGKFMLAVRRDADTSMVDTDGDYAPLQVDALGRLKVAADISVTNGFEKLEDSAHASGDVGGYVLSVRQDTLAASAGDGDYQSFKTDALGRLWINETHQSLVHAAVSVADTATDLVASDLANRKKILVQNADNKAIFIGGASVTTANGLRLSGGGVLELEIGPGVNLHAITASGTADVRVVELA